MERPRAGFLLVLWRVDRILVAEVTHLKWSLWIKSKVLVRIYSFWKLQERVVSSPFLDPQALCPWRCPSLPFDAWGSSSASSSCNLSSAPDHLSLTRPLWLHFSGPDLQVILPTQSFPSSLLHYLSTFRVARSQPPGIVMWASSGGHRSATTEPQVGAVAPVSPRLADQQQAAHILCFTCHVCKVRDLH